MVTFIISFLTLYFPVFLRLMEDTEDARELIVLAPYGTPRSSMKLPGSDCPEADDIQMRCRFHSVGFTSTYAFSSDPTEYSGNYTQHTGYNPKMTKSRRSSSEQLLDTCNTTKHHSSGYREETLPFSLRSTRWRSFRLYPSQLSVNTAKGELAQT